MSVCREVEKLKAALGRRTDALLALERAWAEWVGNPAKVSGYRPDIYSKSGTSSPDEEPLIPGLNDEDDSTSITNGGRSQSHSISDVDPEIQQSHHHIHTTRPRPTLRKRLFGTKIDAIEYWEKEFIEADEQVKSMRSTGRFEATHVAFVTFEDVKDAVCLYLLINRLLTRETYKY